MPTAPTASVLSETRIGLFEISGATRTELSAAVSDRSQWACGSPSREIARVSSDPGIDEPLAMSNAGSLSYFSVDGLGSVVATNDPAGTVTHSVVFDAWGNVKSESGTRTHPFTYTGREVGEAGLHFYRARYYQPGVGRFLQEDPMRFEAGVHFYGYVHARPMMARDPLGLFDLADVSQDVVERLEVVSDVANGFAENITLGATRAIHEELGTDNQIDRCSSSYKLGQWSGVAWSTAFGGALGARAAGAKAVGKEFSHWIPGRALKNSPAWLRKGFGRSPLNGNYVTPYRHYLHDPYRYPIGWRSFGSRFNPLLRQVDRLPRLPLGVGIGFGVGTTSRQAGTCGCE